MEWVKYVKQYVHNQLLIDFSPFCCYFLKENLPPKNKIAQMIKAKRKLCRKSDLFTSMLY